MKLDWLADVIADEGVEVREYRDWKTRTMVDFSLYTPVGLINHHTAPPVPYPLDKLLTKCNITITPEGVVWVLNAGWAYDSGYGDPLVLLAVSHDQPVLRPTDTYSSLNPVTPGGTNPGVLGNRWFVDIEVQHPGDGSPLPAPAREALIKTNAAICRRMAWDPATRLIGHREWTRRKIDPRWDGYVNPMPGIRADTRAEGPKEEGDDMFVMKKDPASALKGMKVEFWSRQLRRAGQDINPRNTDYDTMEQALWNVAGYGVGGIGPGEADRILAAVRKAESVAIDETARDRAEAAHQRLNKLHQV